MCKLPSITLETLGGSCDRVETRCEGEVISVGCVGGAGVVTAIVVLGRPMYCDSCQITVLLWKRTTKSACSKLIVVHIEWRVAAALAGGPSGRRQPRKHPCVDVYFLDHRREQLPTSGQMTALPDHSQATR